MNIEQDGALRAQPGPKRKENLALAALGFGLCRAWIVACLAIPAIHETVYGTNWLYLIMGALAALFVAFATHSAVGKSERFREHAAESTFGLILASALVVPASLMLDSLLLAFVGFMTGGVAAGMLQVLWGERFAAHENTFVTIASALAAIVTAACLAPSAEVVRMAGYVLFPLCSFLLLVTECKRNRISWRTGRSIDEIDQAATASSQAKMKDPPPRQTERKTGACGRARASGGKAHGVGCHLLVSRAHVRLHSHQWSRPVHRVRRKLDVRPRGGGARLRGRGRAA